MASSSIAPSLEHSEKIEWDMPMGDVQGNDIGFIDFNKLSMSTEMRNKIWESDNKTMLNSIDSNSTAPLLDQNINSESSQGGNNFRVTSCMRSPTNSTFSNTSTFSKYLPNHQTLGRNIPVSNSVIQGKHRFGTQPLLQSPIPMPNERKTPELLSTEENGSVIFDNRRLNESQTVKEELLEMKSILTRLAAQTEDISGLPQPVQLALKVIKLEGAIQEKDVKMQGLEDSMRDLKNKSEKSKKDYEFEIEKQKKENQLLKEKLDYKATLDATTKGKLRPKDEKMPEDKQMIEKLKEEIQGLNDKNDQKGKELDELSNEMDHKLKMLKFDVSNGEKEVSHLKQLINEQQTKEQIRKNEIEHYIKAAREAMERERQDRYLLLVEQNKLKHKVEKLSESCKSYQLKNEELCRIQNEVEQECVQFRKLKKMIQEHGLPNHEQLIMLQQQTEMFKDDVLSERKDRERAQAQREKLRRDLEILQSRNQSLQEQVYKYQEHIMRLNTGDRRYQHHPELMLPPQPLPHQPVQPQIHQGNGKFMRQFSGPAYFNPKIRREVNVTNPLIKSSPIPGNHLNQSSSRHNAFASDSNSSRVTNGFSGNHQNRNSMRSSPQGYSSGQFDPWQQRSGGVPQQPAQQPLPQRNLGTGNFNSVNRSPRSPLLGPNGDPWVLPPSSSAASQAQQQLNQINQISGGLGYTSNIWSQQATGSPTFNSSNASHISQTNQSNWQYSEASNNFSAPPLETSQMDSVKAIPGGETWSTAIDDLSMSSSAGGSLPSDTSDYHSAPGDSQNGVVNGSAASMHGIGGFQCGKCSIKFHDTESFRAHAEKCFN